MWLFRAMKPFVGRGRVVVVVSVVVVRMVVVEDGILGLLGVMVVME